MTKFVTSSKARTAASGSDGFDALGRRVWSADELVVIDRLSAVAPVYDLSSAPRV